MTNGICFVKIKFWESKMFQTRNKNLNIFDRKTDFWDAPDPKSINFKETQFKITNRLEYDRKEDTHYSVYFLCKFQKVSNHR